MEIKEVALDVLNTIIAERLPLGLFYSKEGNVFLAVDNSKGDAFVEEFSILEDCIKYLKGDDNLL